MKDAIAVWREAEVQRRKGMPCDERDLKCSYGDFMAYSDLSESQCIDVYLNREFFHSPIEWVAYRRLIEYVDGTRLTPQKVALIEKRWDKVEGEDVYETYPVKYRLIDIGIEILPELRYIFKNKKKIDVRLLPTKKEISLHDEYSALYKEVFLGVEIDGYEFHNDKDKVRFRKQAERERELKESGYEILRFTGSEIHDMDFDFPGKVLKAIEKKKLKFFNKYLRF